ncbi:MAG: HAD family hydrolase [Candidatus Hodarchaeales archaeon]|jgi:HAD superfamily hydrolase (TIGR01549 family)
MIGIRCIIFDVDGTLVDNSISIIKLFQELVVKYLGESKRMSQADVLSLWGPPGDEIFKRIFPPEKIDEAWAEFLGLYRKHHSKKGFFSREELMAFRDHVQFLAIFTGKSRQTNRITMEKLGIQDCFDLIYTGNDVERSKPYPDALFRIMEDLELKKDEVVFLGDSHLDVEAGRAAGISILGALWGAVEIDKLKASNPDHLFETPHDFIEFIQMKK